MVGQRGHLLLDEQDDVHGVLQLSFLEHLHKAFVCLGAHLVDIGAHAAIQPLRLSQLVDAVGALEAVQVLPISGGYSGGKGVIFLVFLVAPHPAYRRGGLVGKAD